MGSKAFVSSGSRSRLGWACRSLRSQTWPPLSAILGIAFPVTSAQGARDSMFHSLNKVCCSSTTPPMIRMKEDVNPGVGYLEEGREFRAETTPRAKTCSMMIYLDYRARPAVLSDSERVPA